MTCKVRADNNIGWQACAGETGRLLVSELGDYVYGLIECGREICTFLFTAVFTEK